jgi:hypothetical protein
MIALVSRLFAGYSRHTDEDRPLGAYAGLIGLFNMLVAAGVVLARGRDARLPPRLETRDIVLLAFATHKISRLLTKDMVTSALRAPFTQFEKGLGDGEVQESTRGTGVQHAIGELITCPFCLGQWVLALLGIGIVVVPRPTRFLAGLCAALTGADFLHFAYAAARKRAE